MAASRAKQKAHRAKMLEKAKSSVKLHEPISQSTKTASFAEKIKVTAKSSRSALIPGEGRSMGMDID